MGCHHRHGIQCIIPPHMADAIKENGSDEQRQMIEELETLSEEFRSKRQGTSATAALGFVQPLLEGADVVVGQLYRKVYDAEESGSLQSKLARSEGDEPHEDPTVNEAYDGAGDTYNLYKDIYGRNSLDGQGLPLISSVHVRRKYNNAFWNGEQMAYGDGDGKLFIRFTKALTVIGHELSHGVVQFSGGLQYYRQSGALNEHVADVFGCLTEQYKLKQTADQADWLVGKEILAEGIKGKALRSMKEPGTAYDDPLLGKDPQPGHMDQYVETSRDNGGVHINSGIPNRAFYLVATSLGGNAWEVPGKIWYQALQDLQNSSANFVDWAKITIKTAEKLHGEDSKEAKAVTKAWHDVGVLKEGVAEAAASSSSSDAPVASSAIASALPNEPAQPQGLWAKIRSWFRGGS